jgi:predicted deacylase
MSSTDTEQHEYTTPRAFRYDAEVQPGEKRHFMYEVGETYLGRSIEVPVTIINGEQPGPRLFLTAAIHGDELNGVNVLQQVARRYEPTDIHGTLVCIHVVNVPGYIAQQRYIPGYDLDLNRSFPGKPTGNDAQRMAHVLYERFLSKCDMGIDFHTSTRNRMTTYHVRANMDDPAVERLARAFGPTLFVSSEGSSGMLRRVASADGIPTITVEMGEAHRFQPLLGETALTGIENVMASYGMLPNVTPRKQTWSKVVSSSKEKKWIRADDGGLVEWRFGPYPIVEEGETICTVSNHFGTEEHVVTAPFTGFLAGILANPMVLPGQPVCHLVKIDPEDRPNVEAIFDVVGYQYQTTYHWLGETQTTPPDIRDVMTPVDDVAAGGEPADSSTAD